MPTKLQDFSSYWERETDGTLALMRALPSGQYDFRPDAGGRSIGELAWHLAEVDAYVTLGIEQREFNFDRLYQAVKELGENLNHLRVWPARTFQSSI
jgi:uncharacterized damage-inducible protein DinB